MKLVIIYIGVLFCLISCAPRQKDLISGDLLFEVGCSSDMASAISAATGRSDSLQFTHVGIAIVTDSMDWVLEATPEVGVQLTPTAQFLESAAKIDGKPIVVAKRLRDTTGLAEALTRGLEKIGLPYDYYFLPDNGKYYCSELIWDLYRDSEGKPRFKSIPMNFRAQDGSMPQYWIELFDQLGEPIPEGAPGTNPQDMSREEILEEVFRWF